jgi:hypothetical protein
MESEGKKISVHNFINLTGGRRMMSFLCTSDWFIPVEMISNLHICEGRNSNLSKSRRR